LMIPELNSERRKAQRSEQKKPIAIIDLPR
jgi:hypothetical protein